MKRCGMFGVFKVRIKVLFVLLRVYALGWRGILVFFFNGYIFEEFCFYVFIESRFYLVV